MSGFSTVNFFNKLEEKAIISKAANIRIQHFLEFNYANFGKLFLMLCGLIGTLFISAGIFSIISHNWDDLPKHLRGVLSIIPLITGLFFYYKAIFQKKTSIWIEVTSLFLFMMIGASIALISSTYQLNGDFDRFIIVWLVLSIPLFYIGKASAFALFYFGLSVYFAFPILSYGFFGIPSDFNYNDKIYWFYIFVLAFLPHFYSVLNKNSRKQGIRAIYLGYLLALTFFTMLPVLVKGGWIFWGMTIALGFLILGNRFYQDNLSILAKPFQFVAYLGLFIAFITFGSKQTMHELFKSENLLRISNFSNEQLTYYFVGLISLIAVSVYAWRTIRKENNVLRMLTALPLMVIFLMLLHYIYEGLDFDVRWLGQFLFTTYVIVFGILTLAKGANERRISSLLFGLFLICFILWVRYFDTTLPFWLKGIFFMLTGFGFFVLNFIYAEELSISSQLPPNEKENHEEE